MLRSIAELAAYGTLAALLTVASLTSQTGEMASSSATSNISETSETTSPERASLTAERGALLFAVKGCTGCHMHAAFPNAGMQIGPDLTYLANRAATRVAGLDALAYVRQSLREPGAYRATANFATVMPDLNLTDEQIDSLAVFLLSPAP